MAVFLVTGECSAFRDGRSPGELTNMFTFGASGNTEPGSREMAELQDASGPAVDFVKRLARA